MTPARALQVVPRGPRHPRPRTPASRVPRPAGLAARSRHLRRQIHGDPMVIHPERPSADAGLQVAVHIAATVATARAGVLEPSAKARREGGRCRCHRHEGSGCRRAGRPLPTRRSSARATRTRCDRSRHAHRRAPGPAVADAAGGAVRALRCAPPGWLGPRCCRAPGRLTTMRPSSTVCRTAIPGASLNASSRLSQP